MITLQKLHRIAESKNIPVDYFCMKKREALAIMDEDGDCAIALDPSKLADENDERNKLAHELGHCCTGAFYNEYSTYDCRQRHENRADKWAIRKLITAADLDEAIATGHTEYWDLAEHFGVPEPLIRKAVCLYTHGNLAADLYF